MCPSTLVSASRDCLDKPLTDQRLALLPAANQYGASRALEPMLARLHPWGIFTFWSIECVVSFFYCFLLPETAGCSLEEMDELFASKLSWRKKPSAISHSDDLKSHDEGNRPDAGDRSGDFTAINISQDSQPARLEE